jgi:hypothetical protein
MRKTKKNLVERVNEFYQEILERRNTTFQNM